MIVLTLQEIKKAFVMHEVLTGASLLLPQGRRIGLVGVNGSGKSTLMRIITGEEFADSGQIVMQKGLKMGYLAQQGAIIPGGTVWDEVHSVFEEAQRLEHQMRTLEHDMATAHIDETVFSQLTIEYERVTHAFEESGGYAWPSLAQGVLIGLGFTKDEFDRKTESLSGGELTRLRLARLLLTNPDVLLLDEPTNHLDLNALAWLEDFLQKYRGSVLLISHDRYFLDAVCDGVCELQFGRISQYDGNYSKYLELRQAAYERQLKEFTMQEREIERQRVIIARYKMFNTEAAHIKARSREKHVLKLQEAQTEKPMDEQNIHFSFRANRRSGVDVILCENLKKSFGSRTLFEHANLHIRVGERVAIIGPNGAGKSTLINIILGHLQADEGSVRLGSQVSVGYYDQHQALLHPEKTALDELWDDFPKLEVIDIRNALATFLLTGDDVFQRISTLSGGEKARVMLAKLMLRGDNVLILDEPTNHLDMDSREMLEAALMDYPGTLIAVSHDRYFINRLCSHIVQVDNGITKTQGNWDDLQELKKKQLIASDAIEQPQKTRTQIEKEKKMEKAIREKRKQARIYMDQLEKTIEEAEAQLKELEIQLQDPSSFEIPTAGKELTAAYTSLQEHIKALMDAWEDMARGQEES